MEARAKSLRFNAIADYLRGLVYAENWGNANTL